METLVIKLNKIQQSLKAPKNQKNSFGNYSYRSCEDILEAVKQLLDGLVLTISDEIICIGGGSGNTVYKHHILDKTSNKLVVSEAVARGERYYVKALAIITDGKDRIEVSAMAREAEVKKGMDEAQITGSASSYARNYALNGLFCIDDTKDPDTNEQQKVNKQNNEVF